MNEIKYYKKITANQPVFSLRLKEVWQYRELIGVFTKKYFAVRYRQTVLGPLWLFLSPVFSSIISLIVFGQIAHLGTGEVPPFLFYLTGNAVWGFFSNCINRNSGTFRDNAYMFSKVYFPRLCMSISYLLSELVDFGIRILLALVLMVYYCVTGVLTFSILRFILVPVIMLEIGILAMSIGVMVSSLTTKYRDFSVILGLVLNLWMPITPVAYPMAEITNLTIQKLFYLNPMTGPMELFRYAFLGQGEIMKQNLIYGCILTVVLAILSIAFFNKVERNFTDTI